MAKTTARARVAGQDSKTFLPHTLKGLDAYLADYWSPEKSLARVQAMLAEAKEEQSGDEITEGIAYAATGV